MRSCQQTEGLECLTGKMDQFRNRNNKCKIISCHIICKARQSKNNKKNNNIYYKSLQLGRSNSKKLGVVKFNIPIKEDCVMS